MIDVDFNDMKMFQSANLLGGRVLEGLSCRGYGTVHGGGCRVVGHSLVR